LASCTGAVDTASASLDGRPVHPIVATSQTSFAFVAHRNSSTGFTPGVHQAVAWGLWIGPLPLSEGKHTLRFAATSGSFATEVTYRLTVTGASGPP
jgi:hypothetical protein